MRDGGSAFERVVEVVRRLGAATRDQSEPSRVLLTRVFLKKTKQCYALETYHITLLRIRKGVAGSHTLDAFVKARRFGLVL